MSSRRPSEPGHRDPAEGGIFEERGTAQPGLSSLPWTQVGDQAKYMEGCGEKEA